MKLLLLSALLFSVAYGQQLINLNTLKGGNEVNQLNGDAPYGIYVSATSDSTTTLSSIFVVLKETMEQIHQGPEYIETTTKTSGTNSIFMAFVISVFLML
ncbi:Protein CBG27002 [Caenorhabditis briggsae]|uniref:Protein CBG27002 n=1 Tax=Caenorhabditis briggsae TaxID=6238 RepID=B6IIF9_CAEBR|nr:Protein CBG27002 [Caenorhabditis briggsae]CAR99689.1 Protein CBG27002 [Caenorhabditis briggsae]